VILRSTTPITTGFPSLDTMLGGGLRRGDLLVLGGDAGSGKSSLALAIASRAASSGANVAFHTTEMRPERLLLRLIAMREKRSVDEIERDPSTRSVDIAARGQPALFGGKPGAGVDELLSRLHDDTSRDLFVIDHLQSLVTDRNVMDEELASAVRKLKGAALESNVAMLLVAHCGTNRATSPVPRPTLSDFGALGAVEQHADTVLGLYREEMYTSDRDLDGAAEVHILKNRHGNTGYVDLYFYRKWLRFEDMLEP
jgi:replicative DNA helicase